MMPSRRFLLLASLTCCWLLVIDLSALAQPAGHQSDLARTVYDVDPIVRIDHALEGYERPYLVNARMSKRGDVFVVWQRPRDDDPNVVRVEANRFDPSTQVWRSRPERIDEGWSLSRFPRTEWVIDDDGEAFLLWAMTGKLLARRFAGHWLDTDVLPMPFGSFQGIAAAQSTTGDVLAVFSHVTYGEGRSQPYYAYWTAAEEAWTAPERLPLGTSIAGQNPAVAAGPNCELLVGIETRVDAFSDFFLRSLRFDPVVGWGPPVTVYQTSTRYGFVYSESGAGFASITRTLPGGRLGLYGAAYRRETHSWPFQETVLFSEHALEGSSVDCDRDGNALLVGTVARKIRGYSYHPADRSWDETGFAISGRMEGMDPKVAAHDGRFIVVWKDRRYQSRMMLREFHPMGGWLPVWTLPTERLTVQDHWVLWKGDDIFVILWAHEPEADYAVYALRLLSE